MKKHIHVVGAVIVEQGKILCAQRGNTKALPYKWEFPGGKIEEGESPQEALKREIDEEMNCVVEIGEFIETTVYEYDFGFVHLSTFYCTLVSGQPTLTEHVEIKWLPAGELDQLDWAPADIPAVERIRERMVK
ncbi:(deoxy)nucleoside triphosphate pyrophosphohydrolase [Saccharibacillus kuerlensis]|uniref:8-oxo-dGTP diphosphatase n=1 Tax=Saccharibacillus kuerlensis TaxID=459527 RepID=A0ABQ2L0C0_9BACL|nr:(deoxy)nucleoside triphosphate pyrophosphohydrolase [Saccharibacillus kuerlensis]GGN98591.1 DNA mismatch repair protein MutT [Saccharibacillus kuerlensis]